MQEKRRYYIAYSHWDNFHKVEYIHSHEPYVRQFIQDRDATRILTFTSIEAVSARKAVNEFRTFFAKIEESRASERRR